MARNQKVTIDTLAYSPISDGAVETVTVQNQSGNVVEIAVSSSGVPADTVDGLYLYPNQGQQSMSLAEAFPHLTGPVTVYARAKSGKTSDVYVGHA